MIALIITSVNSTLVLTCWHKLVGCVAGWAGVANDASTYNATIADTSTALVVPVDLLGSVAGGVDVTIGIAVELPATSPGAEDGEADDVNVLSVGHGVAFQSL